MIADSQPTLSGSAAAHRSDLAHWFPGYNETWWPPEGAVAACGYVLVGELSGPTGDAQDPDVCIVCLDACGMGPA